MIDAKRPCNRVCRRDSRDGMLVDHLLLAHDIEHDREIIKTAHTALDLETIDQMDGHGNILLADLIEETVLQIDHLIRHKTPPFSCSQFLAGPKKMDPVGLPAKRTAVRQMIAHLLF